MRKQRLFFAVFAILMMVSLLPFSAQAEVTWDASAVSDYMFRGFHNIGGRPAFQPSAMWTIGESGLMTKAWFSWALADRPHTAIMDEIQLIAEWNGLVSEGVNLTGGLFYLGYYTQDGWSDPYSSTYEIYGGMTFVNAPYSPGVMLFWDFNDKGGNGPYIQGYASTQLLEASGVPVIANASVGLMGQEWPLIVNGEDEKGVSDVNLGVSMPLEYFEYTVTPSFTATFVPMRSVNPDHFVFWGRLSVSGRLLK